MAAADSTGSRAAAMGGCAGAGSPGTLGDAPQAIRSCPGPADDDPERDRLKPPVEEVGRALGHHPQGLGKIGWPEAHRRESQATQRQHIPPSPPHEIRWSPQQPWFYKPGHPLKKRLVIRISPGVAGGEAGNLCGGRLIVTPDKQVPSVRERAEECRVFRQDLVAEA